MANGAKAFETGTRSALTEFLSQIAPAMLKDQLQYDRQQELFERELEEKKRVSNEENDKFMLGQFMKISNIDQRKAAINAYNPSSELGEKQHIAFKDVVETSADRLADANGYLKAYQNMIGSRAENFVYKGVTYDRDSGLNELEVRLGNSVEPQIKGMYQNYLTSTNIKDKITNQNLATVFKSFLPEEAGTAIDKLAQQSNMSSDRFSQTVNVLISTNQDAKTATIRFFNTEQGQDVLESLSDENKRAMLKDLDLLGDSVVSDDGSSPEGKQPVFNEQNIIELSNGIKNMSIEEIIKDTGIDEDTAINIKKEVDAFLKLDETLDEGKPTDEGEPKDISAINTGTGETGLFLNSVSQVDNPTREQQSEWQRMPRTLDNQNKTIIDRDNNTISFIEYKEDGESKKIKISGKAKTLIQKIIEGEIQPDEKVSVGRTRRQREKGSQVKAQKNILLSELQKQNKDLNITEEILNNFLMLITGQEPEEEVPTQTPIGPRSFPSLPTA